MNKDYDQVKKEYIIKAKEIDRLYVDKNHKPNKKYYMEMKKLGIEIDKKIKDIKNGTK